jgi:Tfp pilus assembly protein PilV
MGQKGDTIVEVLIAMAVAASVLALSYSTMNRNLLITQDSQERTEASKLAQGQIEALRQIATLPAASVNLCINTDGSTQTITGAPNVTATGLSLDDFTKYTGQCTNGLYHIALTSPNQKDYHIYVRWDRIVNGERDEVIMVYRL